MTFFAKCEQCGRFVGFANHVVYTLYGRSQDIDPPDPVFECLECWDRQDEKWRRLTYSISWIKPVIVRDGQRVREGWPAGVKDNNEKESNDRTDN